MAYKEKEIIQVRFRIQSASKILREPASKISYWTEVFDIPFTPDKRGKVYSEGGFRTLKNIKRLHDTKEYTLFGIARKLGLKYLGETVASDPIMSDINQSLVDMLVNDYLLDQMKRRGGKKISIQRTTYNDGLFVDKFFFKRTNRHNHKTKCYFLLSNKNGDFWVGVHALALVPTGEVVKYGADFEPIAFKLGYCLLKKDIVFGLDAFMSAVTLFNQILCTDFTNTKELQKNRNETDYN